MKNDKLIIQMVMREMGKKFDKGKPMVDLLVPEFIEDVAEIMTMGAEKYGLENWKKNLAKRRILAALYRHVLAYHRGETIDPESGLSHLCHVACNAMFLYWYDEVKDRCPECHVNMKAVYEIRTRGELDATIWQCPKCKKKFSDFPTLHEV